jgi:Ca2+-binding EF-hand superfamily protein
MSTTAARRAAFAILVGAATCVGVAAQSRTPMRFASLDENKDGVITRREWNGSDRSFEVHDWNRDGILSGEEVRQGGRRRGGNDQQRSQSDRDFNDWTSEGFIALDRNRDNRISRAEWQADLATFRRVDSNNDGLLSRVEFFGDEPEPTSTTGRRGRFDAVDTNNDSRISRAEWQGTAERFALLDANRDGVLSREEYGSSRTSPTSDAVRTQAWTAGRDRGLVEGRQAGKEDRQLRNQWDLEGQRELETADSGYEARFGSRPDYQAGYREGFRRGYVEGFGPR